MKNILFVWVVLFVWGFSSCKPEVTELVVPQGASKPVISSQCLHGGWMAVSLTRSFGASERPGITADSSGIHVDQRLLIPNAEVWLTGGGQETRLMKASPGLFLLEQPVMNDYNSYRLEVRQEGEVIASASEVKLPPVKFDSVSARKADGNTNAVSIRYKVSSLRPGQEYFVVNYFNRRIRDSLPAKPDPGYIARRMLEQNTDFDLFTASDFREGVYEMQKEVATQYNADTFVVSLACISAGEYRFLSARKKAGTLFNQLRGEVINFPTNVQNGYGYFSLSEPDLRILRCR